MVNNIDMTCRRLREINPNVEIAVSAMFLLKYGTSINLQIVETNAALERHCLSNGLDFIRHSKIAFNHLVKFGIHLTLEGNRVFSTNLNVRSQCG